jgi:tRNA dimethylallyltransferase
MDIGTGKDLDEYGNVPYHLIDILDAGEEFSVFAFQRLFNDAFTAIRSRGRLPILVGGTGLYLDAVLRGYRMIEVPKDPVLRDELAELPLEALRERLLSLNPRVHNSTDLIDRERLVRAIEIAAVEQTATEAEAPALPELRPLVFGIRLERELLRRRITERLKARLSHGMIEEVERLLAGGLPAERLDWYGLEYRFVTRYLRGELNRNDMFQKLNAAIHEFAKKQEHWFRRMEKNGVEIIWLDGGNDPLAALLAEKARREG